MLILTRRVGETIVFKTDPAMLLTVQRIERRWAEFTLRKGDEVQTFKMRETEGRSIAPHVSVYLRETRGGQCRLAFDAPQSVSIVRQEIDK